MDRLAERLKQSEELINWIGNLIGGHEIPANDRARAAASCLDVALEHHKAIHLTTTAELYGSAFALVRLQFEAYVRGCWIQYSASDIELEAFLHDRIDKSISAIIRDLERNKPFSEGVLSELKTESWSAMNSYTHTGLLQVARRSTTTEIGGNYREDEIVQTVVFADTIGVLSALPIIDMLVDVDVDRNAMAESLLARMNEYAVASE